MTTYCEVRGRNCSTRAVTTRQDFRWGRGIEPPVVPITVQLCAGCAASWDDRMAEGEAEGLAS